MKQLFKIIAFAAGLSLTTMRAVASPDVDRMSDIEVSEYAVRMSSVIEEIQYRQLCVTNDTQCVRAVFARNGISYDDKESVQKRLVLMIGSIH